MLGGTAPKKCPYIWAIFEICSILIDPFKKIFAFFPKRLVFHNFWLFFSIFHEIFGALAGPERVKNNGSAQIFQKYHYLVDIL